MNNSKFLGVPSALFILIIGIIAPIMIFQGALQMVVVKRINQVENKLGIVLIGETVPAVVSPVPAEITDSLDGAEEPTAVPTKKVKKVSPTINPATDPTLYEGEIVR